MVKMPVAVGEDMALLRHPLIRSFKTAGAAGFRLTTLAEKSGVVQPGYEQQKRRTPISVVLQASIQRRGGSG